MQRGEVWWVNFEPAQGGEIKKTRPAVIVSNNHSNQALNRLQVIPLTSKSERVYPSEALITLNGKQSKAMADQITTACKTRLKGYIGKVSRPEMLSIEKAIKIQLGISL
jgi:mRNA interferase MazF